MNYVYLAVKVAPLLASVATVTSTIHTTYVVAKRLGSIVSYFYATDTEEEEAWQYIDGGPIRLEADG